MLRRVNDLLRAPLEHHSGLPRQLLLVHDARPLHQARVAGQVHSRLEADDVSWYLGSKQIELTVCFHYDVKLYSNARFS